MTISFSGLGSGLNTSDWVDALVAAKKIPITTLQNKVASLNNTSSNLSNLKSSYTSLLTAITKLTDSNLSSSANVFAQNKVTSSDSSVLSVTGSSGATAQTLDVAITRLATNTVARSATTVGKTIDESTVFSSMANGAAKTGSFTFYVDNQKFSIDVSKTDTLANIKDKMVNATKTDDNPDGTISVDITGGKFTIDAGSKSVSLGSAQDKSNLAAILALKKDTTLNKYSSSSPVVDLNMSAKLTSSESGFSTPVTAGTFKIGNATITVDSNTTLNSLIDKINTNTDAGATASFDTATGKFSLTSKSTGAFNINVENGTSNFLEAVGLTSGNKIATGTQTLGDNALMTINNHDVESFSNTVTSESTGLTGLVFNLNNVTTAGKNIKVKIEQDNSQSLSAVKSLISEYNNVVNKTNTVSTTDSGLRYETSLRSIQSKMRSSIADTTLSSGTYKTLADIGISTGKVGTTGTDTTNQLQIDETKFNEAMAKDPNAVKQLLIGDLKSKTGFVGSLKTTVEAATNTTNGYFASKDTSIKSQVKLLNDQITRKTASLDDYKTTLTAQFNAMDQTISKLKAQYSKITGSSSTTTS